MRGAADKKNAFYELYAVFANSLQKKEKTTFFTLFPSFLIPQAARTLSRDASRRATKTLAFKRVFRKSTVSNVFYKKIIAVVSFVFKGTLYKKQKTSLFVLSCHSLFGKELAQTSAQKFFQLRGARRRFVLFRRVNSLRLERNRFRQRRLNRAIFLFRQLPLFIHAPEERQLFVGRDRRLGFSTASNVAKDIPSDGDKYRKTCKTKYQAWKTIHNYPPDPFLKEKTLNTLPTIVAKNGSSNLILSIPPILRKSNLQEYYNIPFLASRFRR